MKVHDRQRLWWGKEMWISVCEQSMKGKSFFFQAEDGIREAQESRGLGDVYKRQVYSPNFRRHMLKMRGLVAAAPKT